ncbi:TetR/AcrR family transcriptional regulator [Microcella humidisoli]|uniref:TetR/AcrR family transcriptional regulator n=1 Tax=Microcella humidisoli TaxID=2963406 RepID=A0ABY5FWX4_9MICO|nr:TetR/AcrR family transcriptional regulator [Microcella humidisoli]UTT62798.1 TetR/AcrR family transcriptional regulator [Microcella humidisoli]
MTPPRDALSHDRVLQAALALADAHGLDALSMRRLGAELGVEAMSLYRHVASKEALLDAMVDAIVRGWIDEHDASITDWRARLAAVMHRAHDSLMARPWAVELVANRPSVGDGRLRYAETITTALLDAGFTAQLAHHGLHIVDGTIMGFTAQQARRPSAVALGDRVRELYDGALASEYPGITRTIREHHDHDEEYALMVDLVIEGLARLRDGRMPARTGVGADYAIARA